MIVISDTNVLSSLGAGEALPELFSLFAQSKMCIPPGVRDELQVGLERGRTYLKGVLQAIEEQHLEVLPLLPEEEQLVQRQPHKLNTGERQAIALAQTRKALLLCNDRRAIRYCQQQDIRTLNLIAILRLLWVRKLMSKRAVRDAVERMERIENLVLTSAQRSQIFAPRGRS